MFPYKMQLFHIRSITFYSMIIRKFDDFAELGRQSLLFRYSATSMQLFAIATFLNFAICYSLLSLTSVMGNFLKFFMQGCGSGLTLNWIRFLHFIS
jgi:hypothetical protein